MRVYRYLNITKLLQTEPSKEHALDHIHLKQAKDIYGEEQLENLGNKAGCFAFDASQ